MSNTNPYAAPAPLPAANKAVEVEVEAEVEVNQVEAENTEVPKGTVSEVLVWVGDDKNRAEAAHEAEKHGAKRVTLISALEDILDK